MPSGITDNDRGLSGATLSAADRGLVPPQGASASALSPDGPMSYADEVMSSVVEGRGGETIDGFEVLAAWLELGKDANLAQELRQLARTLNSPEQTADFYRGLFLGLQLGITQATIDALRGYRDGIIELKKTLTALVSGNLEVLETVLKAMLQLIATMSDVPAEKLESIADELISGAESGGAEHRAIMLELGIIFNQAARLKRMASTFSQLTLSEILAVCEDLVVRVFIDSARELTQRLLDVRTSGRMVGCCSSFLSCCLRSFL